MTTVAQQITDRTTNGATYATAYASLKTAWINVRKYDIALSNRRVQSLAASPQSLINLPTFGQPSEWNPACLRHGEFALTPEYLDEWEAEAQAAALTLITNAS